MTIRKRSRYYILELNRGWRDSVRQCKRALERLGLQVEKLAHKTTLRIKRPLSMSWGDFLDAIRSILQPRRGSALLLSSTGRAFICNNAGNRPWKFVRVMPPDF